MIGSMRRMNSPKGSSTDEERATSDSVSAGLGDLASASEWPSLSPLETGLRGRCPRCGQGRLFKGFLTLRPRCDVCGLDYSFADPADGPAFFVMMFCCLPSVGFAVWLEIAYEPPAWVHLVTTLPLTLLTCIPPLRPLKGWLVASQYFYKAEEGHLAPPEEANKSS
ncbi:DUF983 domain-containing protein [Ancylobacter oerskovii]|uniref:DUF983 domain-containing protein n=1 Tax=Ancylobacter oerskovii TaxID=459519 RepID=A0ABW4Z4X5_9HYPH